MYYCNQQPDLRIYSYNFFYYLTVLNTQIWLSMFQKIIELFESNQRPCFIKEHFGIDCPGCGLQRSFIELLKGHLLESVRLYPALLPILFMLTFLCLHIVLKFRNGARILKLMYITNISLIFLHYIYKLIIM